MQDVPQCRECGKPKQEVGVLIPYKGKYLCDLCIIENNNRILAELGEDDEEVTPLEDELKDTPNISLEGDSEEGEAEDEEDAEWSPMTSLDEDSLDYIFRKSGRHKDGGIEQKDLKDERIDPDAVALLPRAVAEQFCLIPLRREGKDLVVAFSDPSDEEALQEVKYFTGMDVNVVAADPEQIEDAISKYYENQEA